MGTVRNHAARLDRLTDRLPGPVDCPGPGVRLLVPRGAAGPVDAAPCGVCGGRHRLRLKFVVRDVERPGRPEDHP